MSKLALFCATCGKEIFLWPSLVREKNYCSRSCRAKDPDIHRAISNAKGAKVKVKCDNCGGEFYKQPAQVHKTNFCGRSCFAASMREQYDVPCGWCGEIVSRKPAELKRRGNHAFCSKEHAGLFYAEEARNRMNELHRDPEFEAKLKASWGGSHSQNNLERYVEQLHPLLRFVGDGKMWLTTKSGGHKCPDFIVDGQRKLVEVWGDFWHKDQEPNDLISIYKEIGFECLVLWENDIWNGNPQLELSSFIEGTN